MERQWPDDGSVPTPDEIETAFSGTDFGTNDIHAELRLAVLKYNAGFDVGWTMEQILMKLGLICEWWTVTERGRRFLYYAYNGK